MPITKHCLLTILLGLQGLSFADANPVPDTFLKKGQHMINQHNQIEQSLNQWQKQFPSQAPGFSYMAKFDGGQAFSGSVGLSDIQHQTPLHTNSIFNLASVSKQFTAFSILLLEQDKRLSLQDAITIYLPELPDYANQITIQDLVYHTGGMVDYMDLAEARNITYAQKLGPKDSMTDLISYPKALHPVNTKFDYSNTGYFLLSQIIERVSQQSLADFAQQRIFTPLKMTNSFIVERYPARKDIVHGYQKTTEDTFVLDESPWEHMGDGAVHSTVVDLMKWGENLSTGQVGGKSLVQKMQQTLPTHNAQNTAIIDHENYAFGLIRVKKDGIESWEHSGGWAGYATYFIRIPSHQLSIAVLGNEANFDAEKTAQDIKSMVLQNTKSNVSAH